MTIFDILVPLMTVVMLLLASCIPFLMGSAALRLMSRSAKKTVHVIRRH